MAQLNICLFGKFSVYCNDQEIKCVNSQKALELFCFLLIYRNQAHYREAIADKLWGGFKIENTKKYLRKALWQLQSSLDNITSCPINDLINVDPEWIEVNTRNYCWLDIETFEDAFQKVRGIRGNNLEKSDCFSLKQSINLYRGDLLDGWYQSWCILERERFKQMFIAMNSKLMSYCESNHEYESGIEFGNRLLRYEHAHERTYRRLMRIHYLAGDRTTALRLYERLKNVLQEELSVNPSERTNQLYQQIVNGTEIYPKRVSKVKSQPPTSFLGVVNTLNRIKKRLTTQAKEQEKILSEIDELEKVFKDYD